MVETKTSLIPFVVPKFQVQVGACCLLGAGDWTYAFGTACIQTKIRLGANFVIKVLFIKKEYVAFCHFIQEWYYSVDKASNLCIMYHKFV